MSENLVPVQNLSDVQRTTLKRRIQETLQAKLIRSIQDNPPDVDLASFKIMLNAGESAAEWDADTANINVTGGCQTCSGICTTCSGV